MKKLAISFIFAQIVSTPVWSQENGNDLHEQCSDTSVAVRFGCSSFISGYFSGIRSSRFFYSRKYNEDRPIFCIPNEVTLGQIVDIVRKDLRDFPEIRNRPTDDVLTLIISSKFPCKHE